MEYQKGFTAVELVWIAVIIAGIIGWIINIVTIVTHISDPITGMFVFRCIGVVVGPLGAVLGYF